MEFWSILPPNGIYVYVVFRTEVSQNDKPDVKPSSAILETAEYATEEADVFYIYRSACPTLTFTNQISSS